MAKKPHDQTKSDKKLRFESLEDRLVLSAQGITDLPDVSSDTTDVPAQVSSDEVSINQSAVTLEEVNQTTGVNHVHENYGFDGSGQTVVVIDSGIAWDHYALGGGYGEGYRVVGGWDFAENDANPFDDGGAGYHGTHVSGIIGSSDSVHQGVASGVDLVSLRVFDDAGNGNLEWVEQALRWVEQNVDTFENPITTVNLSIGTDWNANNLPEWATLEDEFAALESRGIFISVAAGNNFQADPTVGVSYPAVSDHVVPVASHGEDGTLSDFSQRNQNVLVAPGESIMSTVPGHLLGQSVSQSFLGSSGTSMAAPYVAGSSVLIRQAMEFMGYQDVTQEQIYENLRSTADNVFDSITGANYKKINIQSAIEAIIADRYGDTAAHATDIGVLQGGEVLKGTIGTFHDVDVIQFTAGQTGVMTFQFDQTHDLSLVLESLGHAATIDGNTLTLNVEQGQSYQLKVATDAGIGHYSISTTLETIVVPATDLGTVAQFQDSQWQNESSSSSSYQFSAVRDGLLAIQLTPQQGSGQLNVSLYDQNNQLVGTTHFDGQKYTLQMTVEEGDHFTLRIDGAASGQIDIQNLVSFDSGQLTVRGTDSSNAISIQDGETLSVMVDGVEYQFQRTEVTSVGIDAGQGEDTLSFHSSSGSNHTAWMKSDAFYADGSGYQLSAFGFEGAQFFGQYGDVANLYDSSGIDYLVSNADFTRLSGTGFSNTAFGVGKVLATGSQGDHAEVVGSDGDDYLYSAHDLTYLSRNGTILAARGFSQWDYDLKGGEDSAHLIGSWGADRVVATFDSVTLESDGMSRSFEGIEKRYIFGNGGNDSATFYGSEGKDSLYAWHDSAYMQSGNVINYVKGFQSFEAHGGAEDRATMFDSAGDDHFIANRNSVTMTGDQFRNTLYGFGSVDAYASSGNDVASFEYGEGETYQNNGSLAAISANDFYRTAHGFDSVERTFRVQTQSQAAGMSAAGQLTSSVVDSEGQKEEAKASAQEEVFAEFGSDLGSWGPSDSAEEEKNEMPLAGEQATLLATDKYFEQSARS